MTWLFLDVTDPVLLRDGRAAEVSLGGRSTAHPMPQAVLGALRAHVGRQLGFHWDFARADEGVRALIGTPEAPGALRVTGPFYARTTGATACGEASRPLAIEPLLARPADQLAFPRPAPRAHVHEVDEVTLRPALARGVEVSPPRGLAAPLAPLGYRRLPDARKPAADALPPYVTLDQLQLALTTRGATTRLWTPASTELAPPVRERRVHVGIGPQLTARDEALFSTDRLAMPAPALDAGAYAPTTYGYALQLAGWPAERPADALAGPWRLGGKGGLVQARLAAPPTRLCELRDVVLRALEGCPRIRWILTTPGRFARGYLPDFVDPDGRAVFPGTGVTLRLVAAAVGRPLAYSGWELRPARDPARRERAGGAPRATRLLAPPGSVYFFEAACAADARAVVEACWGRSLYQAPAPDDAVDGDPRASAIDAACGLSAGLFGPWDPLTEEGT
jgi:hypothetical protein